MPTDLPYAADAEDSLSYDELQVRLPFFPSFPDSPHTQQVLRLQYQKEVSQAHVTVQTKFNYAWGLIKSPKREDQVEGVGLLQGKALSFGYLAAPQLTQPPDIYRNEPVRRRECLYYLALGYYKMENYEEAKSFVGTCPPVPLRLPPG